MRHKRRLDELLAAFPTRRPLSIRRCDASFAELPTFRDHRARAGAAGDARRLYRCHRLDRLDIADQLAHAAEQQFRRASAIRDVVRQRALDHLGPQHALSTACCSCRSLSRIGFLLAVAIDQRVRAEDTIRSIFLYPYSMSFVVTGLVWQWLLNPTLGHPEDGAQLGLRRLRRSTGSCGRRPRSIAW